MFMQQIIVINCREGFFSLSKISFSILNQLLFVIFGEIFISLVTIFLLSSFSSSERFSSDLLRAFFFCSPLFCSKTKELFVIITVFKGAADKFFNLSKIGLFVKSFTGDFL